MIRNAGSELAGLRKTQGSPLSVALARKKIDDAAFDLIEGVTAQEDFVQKRPGVVFGIIRRTPIGRMGQVVGDRKVFTERRKQFELRFFGGGNIPITGHDGRDLILEIEFLQKLYAVLPHADRMKRGREMYGQHSD